MPDSGRFSATPAVAKRAFTALIAVLLVTSLVAPIMVGPAVADDDEPAGCLYEQIGIPWFSCQPDDPVDVTTDETMMHSMASAEAENMDSHYTKIDNQLEDTSTIASLEARHAIAQAWEDGKTEQEAYQDAMQAIRDYYAVHQTNHLEQKSKTMVQLSNVANAANESEDIHDRWVSTESTGDSDNTAVNYAYLTDNVTSVERELVNGEEHEFDIPYVYVYVQVTDDPSEEAYIPADFANPNHNYHDGGVSVDEDDEDVVVLHSGGGFTSHDYGGRFVIPNVGDIEDGGLPSETVFDGIEWNERWEEIEHQSDQAVANYDVEFVEALYAEMDAGNLDPEDVRGAEGMARYLSGDTEVTDQRFQLALMQMSGMSNPDLAGTSTMVVEYEGYTNIEYNGTESDDERVPELSEYTEDTFEGLLFANDVPDGGFETGQPYATGTINTTGTDLEPVTGSVQMYDVTTGETIHFYEGVFTITEMYDADGEQVETVEWDQPQYDTYNASEFAAYIEDVKDLREAIAQDDAHAGGGGGGGGADTNTLLIAGVLLVLVAMVLAAVAGDS